MIRRAGAILLLLGVLWLPGVTTNAAAQEPPTGRPAAERRIERKPANVSFLFASFVLTWIAIWGYLVAIHRGQKRLEKTLDRMEGEKG